MGEHILFTASELHLAIDKGSVKSVHDQLKVQKIDGAKSWFLGLGVSQGRVVPVTDLGSFAGRQPCIGSFLELESEGEVSALKVDEISGYTCIQPINGLSAVRSSAIGIRLHLSGKSIMDLSYEHHLLDAESLMNSQAFINIAGGYNQ